MIDIGGVRYTKGITLVALVTIVVLLILAGITITYVMGDNSVFKQASEAKLKTDIANWQEKLETAKGPIFIEGLGTFDPDAYFQYIQNQGIVHNKDTDVIDNKDGTYEVTTKPGYVFLVTLMPTPEKPTDAEIEYIGQAGKIPPVIRRIEVSATASSITGKAIISRLGNGTVTYYYKLSTAGDDSYTEIINVNGELGATQSSGIIAGEKYIIKVVAKNDVGEAIKTAEITATKIFIESIILENVEVKTGKTITLIPTILPENATNKNVTLESSNTEVATISDEGIVTGKSDGTTTIIAKATDGSGKMANCTVKVTSLAVADIIGEKQEETITVKDENGNKVVVPGGFRVLPHGTNSEDIDEVEYNYDTNHKPCVQDGIVIADEEDNQFIWIPVGEVKNKAGDVNGAITTITLGRYTFASNGTPTLQQDATDYSSVVIIENYYQEVTENSRKSIPAKNLGDFVNKVKANSGYYMARYEASGASGPSSKGPVKLQYNKVVWKEAWQSTAAYNCRDMYQGNNYVESDLVNSYAWDTTIVFIQKYSGNSNYANKTSVNSSKVNTGEAGDKVCNIHDMSSNCVEWSTEYSTFRVESPCTRRGGHYEYSQQTASARMPNPQTYSETGYSFRPIIYVK